MFGFDKLGIILVVAVGASVLFFPVLLFAGWLFARTTAKGIHEPDRKTFAETEANAETRHERD
jgi:hypothetical protein